MILSFIEITQSFTLYSKGQIIHFVIKIYSLYFLILWGFTLVEFHLFCILVYSRYHSSFHCYLWLYIFSFSMLGNITF